MKLPACIHIFRTAFLLSAMLLSASAGETPACYPSSGGIAEKLRPFVDEHTMAGAVVLVATKDKVLDLESVGYADLAQNKPMRTDDLFWIASMSKPMTATALMMLVDEGKVSVDDPVEKYLPEFKGQVVIDPKDPARTPHPPIHPILIRNILSHTSGLPPISPAEKPTLDLLPLSEAVRDHARDALKFQPGTAYEYSNAGINTAGRIIEVVSGMPYEKFMEERLFRPLGMTDTTFWPTAQQLERLAKSYKSNAARNGLEELNITQLHYPLDDTKVRFPMPAGGLFSTAIDVGKFGQMILNGGTYGGKRYLSENAVHEMTSRQTASNIKQSYGFGWGIEGGSFGHGGAYKTNLHIDPKLGLVTVFMVQQGSDWPNGDGGKILPAFEQAADTEVLASLPPTPQELAPGTPVMQDNFTDKVADIAGHAPTTGTGVWSADYSPNTVIASDGAEALGNVNGGQQGAGAAIASYPFTPATDTLYVLTIRFDFVSHATKDCWAGFGFSGQKAPWMMVRPQNPDGGGSGAAGFYENPDGSGETSMDWSAYAAFYPAFNATIALNTRTNEVAYYINSLLEKKVASAAPSIDHLYFKFYQTGNAAAIKSIGLTAQPVP